MKNKTTFTESTGCPVLGALPYVMIIAAMAIAVILGVAAYGQRGNAAYHAAGFYKDAGADGSGGTEVDVSDQAGVTILDKAVEWLRANAEADTTYTLSLGEDIPSQSEKSINDSVFNNLSGDTLVITTPDAREKSVALDHYGGCLLWLTGKNSKKLILDGAIKLTGIAPNRAPLAAVLGSPDSPRDALTLELKGNAKITGNSYTISPPAPAQENETPGVYYDNGTIVITGAPPQNPSEQASGGGVYVAGGTFIMSGGSITGNAVIAISGSANGGGVLVNNGTFIMTGGSINDNSANSESGAANGGGVNVNSNGTFDMQGGSIKGNTAASGSGAVCKGVWVTGSAVFKISGHASIGQNNEVCLTTNGPDDWAKITLGALKGFGKIADIDLRYPNEDAYNAGTEWDGKPILTWDTGLSGKFPTGRFKLGNWKLAGAATSAPITGKRLDPASGEVE